MIRQDLHHWDPYHSWPGLPGHVPTCSNFISLAKNPLQCLVSTIETGTCYHLSRWGPTTLGCAGHFPPNLAAASSAAAVKNYDKVKQRITLDKQCVCVPMLYRIWPSQEHTIVKTTKELGEFK